MYIITAGGDAIKSSGREVDKKQKK